jgi:uncharacterized membrane protein YphA (DoxX/SURF4 family)
MLNVFPDLLSFAVLAPFILRLALGYTFIYISFFVVYKDRQKFFDYYKKHKYPFCIALVWFFGILNLVVGLFYIIGFLTQVVSLVAVYLIVSLAMCDKEIKSFEFNQSFYIFLVIIAMCLMLLGAGAYAVDLPL